MKLAQNDPRTGSNFHEHIPHYLVLVSLVASPFFYLLKAPSYGIAAVISSVLVAIGKKYLSWQNSPAASDPSDAEQTESGRELYVQIRSLDAELQKIIDLVSSSQSPGPDLEPSSSVKPDLARKI